MKLGAGILAINKKDGKVLLGRRGLKLDNPNTWTLFGGTFNSRDEVTRNTAIREFVEETNCPDKFMLGKIPFFSYQDTHLRFYTYLGVFEKSFVPILNSENVEFGWFEITMLPENLHPGLKIMLENKIGDIKEIIQSIIC